MLPVLNGHKETPGQFCFRDCMMHGNVRHGQEPDQKDEPASDAAAATETSKSAESWMCSRGKSHLHAKGVGPRERERDI